MNQASISVRASVLSGLTIVREESKTIVRLVISELLQVHERSPKRLRKQSLAS